MSYYKQNKRIQCTRKKFKYTDEEVQKIVAEIIHNVLNESKKMGYSYDDLATMSGLSPSAIYRLNSNPNPNTSFSTLMRIIIALEINIEEMFPLEFNKKEESENRNGKYFCSLTQGLTEEQVNSILKFVDMYRIYIKEYGE